jgi:hypothetical protein
MIDETKYPETCFSSRHQRAGQRQANQLMKLEEFRKLHLASCTFLLLCLDIAAIAQVPRDSINSKREKMTSAIELDSIYKNLQLPDSLPSLVKVDSIRNHFNLASDSLQHEYQKNIGRINEHISELNRKIDSLEKLNFSANKYKRWLKKLSEFGRKSEGQLNKKINVLK